MGITVLSYTMLSRILCKNMQTRGHLFGAASIQSRAFSLQVDQLWKIGVVGAGQLGSGIGLVTASKLPDVKV